MSIRVLLLFAALSGAVGRDDGLARTPPMGWSTWYAFGANLNETRVVEMADAIVRTGLRDAGYTLVNLDDAWLSLARPLWEYPGRSDALSKRHKVAGRRDAQPRPAAGPVRLPGGANVRGVPGPV